MIAEYVNGAAPGSPTREYIYSGSRLLAKIEGGVTNYYQADHLSNRVTTDTNGNIVGQQGHYPFGESWYLTNTTTKWQFTSYERDAESGNDYAMARYDVNRLGRFSSPDPLAGSIGDPQSLNRYAYVGNDPINAADPLGLRRVCDWQCWNLPPPAPGQPGIIHCDWVCQDVPDEPSTTFMEHFMERITFMFFGRLHTVKEWDDMNGPPPPQKPWYKNSCVKGALGKGALSVGVDSIGLIPEAGGVARVVGHQAGFVGVVADQAGSSVIKAAGKTTSAASGLASLSDTSPEGLVSTGLTVAGFIPGANDVAAGLSIGLDVFKTIKAIRACY